MVIVIGEEATCGRILQARRQGKGARVPGLQLAETWDGGAVLVCLSEEKTQVAAETGDPATQSNCLPLYLVRSIMNHS